jgi:hypothetical protein
MPIRKRPDSGLTLGILGIVALLLVSGCQTAPNMTGVWTLDTENSTDVDTWSNIEMRITATEDHVAIGRLFNPRRYTRHDSVSFPVDGTQIEVPMTGSAKWLEQPHMGVFIKDGTPEQIRATWEEPGKVLNAQYLLTLQTSQGEATVEILRQYALSDDGSELTITETRSTRPDTLTFIYRRNEQ